MSETRTPIKAHPEPELYEIRVSGHLDVRWVNRFEGLTISLEENGDTLLAGPVIDQAALHGLLKKVRDLGLPLVSVIQVQINETHPYRSKKEIKMNTNKMIARNLLDVRIVLAALWIAEVLSSLNGDTYRLSDSVALKSLLENTGSIKATPELLLVMSIIFVFPILMSAITLILKYSVSRWANRIIGIFYAVIILAFWVLGFVLQSASYEFVWSTAQLVFVLLVVWYAWRWTNPEG